MKMNKYILPLHLLLFASVVYSQSSSFQIDGKVNPKFDGALVTLFTFTGDYIRSVDSAYVENGHFSFEGPEYLYEKSLISMGNYPDSILAAELFLEKGPIEVELKQKSVIRSLYIADYLKYRDSCSIIRRTFSDQGKTQAFYDEGWERYFAYKFQFKKKYIHNGIGRLLFLDEAHYRDDPYFYRLYELLSDRDKGRCDVKDAYESRKKKDVQKRNVGKPFLDFLLIDSVGKEKRISDYVGKPTLLYLDFWASWCGPCLAQMPNIKDLYQKYKDDGFEVLGISLDVTKKSWLNAIKKKETYWPELYVGSQARVEELRKLYQITGIPLGVLIDQSGKVISVECGYWLILKFFLESHYKK